MTYLTAMNDSTRHHGRNMVRWQKSASKIILLSFLVGCSENKIRFSTL